MIGIVKDIDKIFFGQLVSFLEDIFNMKLRKFLYLCLEVYFIFKL